MRTMRKSGHCSIRKLLTARWASIVALLCWVMSYSPPSANKAGGLADLQQGTGYPLFVAMAQDDGISGTPSVVTSSSSSSSSPPSTAARWGSDGDADGDMGVSSSSSSPDEDDDLGAGPSQSSRASPSFQSGDDDDMEGGSEGEPTISSRRKRIPPVSLPSAFGSRSSFPIGPLLSLPPASSARSSPPSAMRSESPESAASSSDETDLLPEGSIDASVSPPAGPRPSTSTPVASCARFNVFPASDGFQLDAAAELHVTTFDDLNALEMGNGTMYINGTTYVSLNGTVGDNTGTLAAGWGIQATFRKGFCSADGAPGEPYRYRGRHGVENALQMHGVVGAVGEISMSSERPFVVTFDDAKSVSVKVRRVDEWEVVACCNLIPTFPIIPDDWTVTIESNLVKQRNTVYKTEFYSSSLQKLRVDQEINRRRVISFVDLNTREIRQVFPNATCSLLNISDVEYGGLEYGFSLPISTLDFFRTLVGLERFDYIATKQNVRGVDVEEWRAQYRERGGSTTYNISMYFAADTWEVNDNMFRRDLKRIHVSDAAAFGDDPDGVEQYHEFFQMRPFIASDPETVFDPCSVFSQVTGCGCGEGATVAEGSRSTASGNGMNLNSEANGQNAVAVSDGEKSLSNNNCRFGLSPAKVVGVGIGLVLVTAAVVSIGWYAYIKSRPDAWAFRFSQKERSFWRR